MNTTASQTNTHFAPELHIPRGTMSIEFYTRFGATEHFCFRNEDGSIHVAELSINGAIFHVHETMQQHHDLEPQQAGGVTTVIGLFVQNVDEVMQKAINITDVTFRRLLKFIKPGVMEYEIDAEIWHSFLSQRASGPAYGSIIASGDRARTLHYVNNNEECKDGELILMDFGARYGNYAADLTRTIPVNGKFGRRQKTVYNACLDLHYYCASILKPGITITDYTEKVGEKATELFQKIGLLKKSDIKNEDPENRAYRKYLYHGISHHLGIDVHDLGTKTESIKAGMVFTIEPGI